MENNHAGRHDDGDDDDAFSGLADDLVHHRSNSNDDGDAAATPATTAEIALEPQVRQVLERCATRSAIDEQKRLSFLCDLVVARTTESASTTPCSSEQIDEFVGLATRWLQLQLHMPEQHRTPLLSLRTVKALALLCEHPSCGSALTQRLFAGTVADSSAAADAQQLLHALIVLLGHTAYPSGMLLVYAIAAFLAVVTQHAATHSWFARGFGLRVLLQVLRLNIVHRAQLRIYSTAATPEHTPTVNREAAWIASNLLRVVYNITQSAAVCETLYYLAPLMHHHHLVLESLVVDALRLYPDSTLRAISIGLLTNIAAIAIPSGSFHQHGVLRALVLLLASTDLDIVSRAARALAQFCAEYPSLEPSIDSELRGAPPILALALLATAHEPQTLSVHHQPPLYASLAPAAKYGQDFRHYADAIGLLSTYSLPLRHAFKNLIGTDPIESLVSFGATNSLLADLHMIVLSQASTLREACKHELVRQQIPTTTGAVL